MPGTARVKKAGGWKKSLALAQSPPPLLVAEVGDWKTFWSGRSVAAWIGLVPIAFWVSVVQSTWPHGPINLHTRYYLSFFIDDV
jgi:hypothetical protein